MENFLKIKKRKIIILLLLFFNQFLLSGYALNYKKIDLVRSEKNNLQGNFYTTFNVLLAEINKDQIKSIKKEEQEEKRLEKEKFEAEKKKLEAQRKEKEEKKRRQHTHIYIFKVICNIPKLFNHT